MGVRQHAPGMPRQLRQHRIFLRSQVNLFAIPGDSPLEQVDGHTSCFYWMLFGFGREFEQVGHEALELQCFRCKARTDRLVYGCTAAQLPGSPADRCDWWPKLLPDRREHGRADPIPFAQTGEFARLLLEPRPFERERGLVEQAFKKLHQLRVDGRRPVVAREAYGAEHFLARANRVKHPFGGLKTRRTAPG